MQMPIVFFFVRYQYTCNMYLSFRLVSRAFHNIKQSITIKKVALEHVHLSVVIQLVGLLYSTVASTSVWQMLRTVKQREKSYKVYLNIWHSSLLSFSHFIIQIKHKEVGFLHFAVNEGWLQISGKAKNKTKQWRGFLREADRTATSCHWFHARCETWRRSPCLGKYFAQDTQDISNRLCLSENEIRWDVTVLPL